MADSRMVRIGILTSEAVNSLSWGAEVFYRRLMSIVDDFGLCDGRIGVLRGSLYSLQLQKVGNRDVVKWLNECVSAELVTTYTVGDKPFLKLEKFGQRIRDGAKPKFPLPPDTLPPPPAATRGDPPPNAAKTYTQTETQTYTGPPVVAGDPMLMRVEREAGWFAWEKISSSERDKLIQLVTEIGPEKSIEILKPIPDLCKSDKTLSRIRWAIKAFEGARERNRPKPAATKLAKPGHKPSFPEKLTA